MLLEARKYLFDIQQAISLIDVWGVVEGKLPQLRREVKDLLAAGKD
jgi:uncharacterized protein with HEPN domain